MNLKLALVVLIGGISGLILISLNQVVETPEKADLKSHQMGLNTSKIERSNITDQSDYPELSLTKELLTEKDTSYVTAREQVEELGASLPHKAVLANLEGEDIHRTPSAILQAGKTISQMVQVVKNNPKNARELSAGIKDCSLNQDIPNTVRAYCLYQYLRFSFVTSDEADKLKSEIGDPVVKLSKAL